MKIGSIPVDAAQFRGWENAFLTKASSIDKTRQNSFAMVAPEVIEEFKVFLQSNRSCVWKIIGTDEATESGSEPFGDPFLKELRMKFGPES